MVRFGNFCNILFFFLGFIGNIIFFSLFFVFDFESLAVILKFEFSLAFFLCFGFSVVF